MFFDVLFFSLLEESGKSTNCETKEHVEEGMENVCPLVVVISDNTFSISEPLFHTLKKNEKCLFQL